MRLSPHHQLVLSDPVVQVHVVGGVVLDRDELPVGRLPRAVARLLVATVVEHGSRAEAAAV